MKKTKGFTLIELLIVVVILGILAVFVFLTLGGALNKPKDARAKNSITEVRKALEQYMIATDNSSALNTGWRAMTSADLTALKSAGVMSFNQIPKDAQNTTIQIWVKHDGVDPAIGQYAVRAKSTVAGRCWFVTQRETTGLDTTSTSCY